MSSVVSNAVGLSVSQRAAASVIEREMTAAGIPPVVIAGAIVNAYAESGLNAAQVTTEKGGAVSVGLFQLYDKGLGAGMTVAARQDPIQNTQRVIQAYRSIGAPIASAAASGASLGDVTALWCQIIERPANAAVRALERRAMAVRLFPEGLSMPLWLAAPASATPARVSTASGLLVASILATTILIGAALWRRGSS